MNPGRSTEGLEMNFEELQARFTESQARLKRVTEWFSRNPETHKSMWSSSIASIVEKFNNDENQDEDGNPIDELGLVHVLIHTVRDMEKQFNPEDAAAILRSLEVVSAYEAFSRQPHEQRVIDGVEKILQIS